MKFSVVCLLVALTLAYVTAQRRKCWPNLSTAAFRQVYCRSNIVFRGSPTFASSSTAMDENGGWMTYTYATFNADQVYRGSPDNAQSIPMSREWNGRRPCAHQAFPRSDSGLLVFGVGDTTNFYTIDSCQRVFSWDCLPQEIKDSLPLDCSGVPGAN